MRVQLSRLVLALVLLTISAPALAQFGWVVAEAQPNVPHGGRASTITVNPTDSQLMLVASESGGVFRSTNGGSNWSHLDSLPQYRMMAVRFLPGSPDVALATVETDWHSAHQGGIWRSGDRGLSWTQAYSPAAPAGVTERFAAREIAVAADSGAIYVATNYGVAISSDGGLTWRMVDPFGPYYHNVITVAAQRGGVILAGGPLGLRRSTDGGTTWTIPATSIGSVWDMHGLTAASVSSSLFFAVDGMTRLWVSEDGGNNFTQLTAAPGGGGGCGGIGFLKAITTRSILPTRPGLALYFGNRCGLYRMFPPRSPLTGRFDFTGAWTALAMDHGDTRDLAFVGTSPTLLGTDGGLHRTANGGLNWTFVGGGIGGYNALQITEVISQKVTSSGETDIYYGTQDNDVRATLSPDKTYPAGWCCEGFYIDMQHSIANDSDSQVTFTACGACYRFRSGRRFTGIAGWNDPAKPFGDIKQVGKNFHVQLVDDSPTFARGFAVTKDLSSTWAQWVTFPDLPRSLAKKSTTPFTTLPIRLRSTVLYQAIKTGFDYSRNHEINRLLRVRLSRYGTTVSYPAMNGFGGLGINPTMFAWYQVFGVDPANPNFLIAPDVINGEMKQSVDGGENWTSRPDLTALVTDSGNFRFSDWIFPHASAIGFSQDNPASVAIGTVQGGLFVSTDRGATFAKVYDSEKVTYVTSINWLSPGSALISTYGRGLWSLVRRFKLPPYYDYCRLPCRLRVFPWGGDDPRIIDPLWDPVPERLKRSLLVADGRILGVRTDPGRPMELTVTPGSQLAWRGAGEPPPFTLRVADTWSGVPSAQLSRMLATGEPIVGIAFGSKDQPIGLIRSNRLVRAAALPAEKAVPARSYEPSPNEITKSPYADQPSVEITGAGAANRVVAGSVIEVRARNIPAADLVVLRIDGEVAARGKRAADGSVVMRAQAPIQPGLHTLIVTDANGKPLAGANFLVAHADQREERGQPPVR